jgi:hypothetical protein
VIVCDNASITIESGKPPVVEKPKKNGGKPKEDTPTEKSG